MAFLRNLAIVVIAGHTLLSPAYAGEAPAWMRAQLAAPVPEHDPETAAAVLYLERTVTVLPNGRIRDLERKVVRILRTEGADRGIVRVDFNSQTKVTGLRAWCIPAQGKDYAVNERDAVETSLFGVMNGELISDVRSRVLRIPAAVPGSIVGYEIEREGQPYFMATEWDFQDTIPVREAHFTLELPPGWQYQQTWLNHAELTAASAGANRWQWEVRDIGGIRVEDDMPPWEGIAGRLVISLLPPPGAQSPPVREFLSWHGMGSWYLELARNRRDASPAIKQKVAELTASKSTPLQKIQALAAFVQSDIRYVAIELGIGGFQPHAASEVFTQRFGDCKDKATLLSTLLHEAGTQSYYVLVNSRRGSITDKTPPYDAFDHVILAIQLPADLQDPSLQATVTHPHLGRLLYFDPTDEYTPLGSLSGYLQAGYGLLVTPDGGELLQLPVLPAGSNSVNRTVHLTLDPSGTVRGDVKEVMLGDAAATERARLHATSQDTDAIKRVETMLSQSLPTFQIEKATLGYAQVRSQPLEWYYTFHAEQYAKVAGDLLMVRPRVFGSKASGLLETEKPRQHPIEFEGPRRDTDVFEIQIPAGYVIDDLPPPVDDDIGFMAYHSKTEMLGQTLRYTRTFEIKTVRAPVDRAEDLKRLYRVIGNDERMTAVLKRQSSQ
jgi:hypothetical protein